MNSFAKSVAERFLTSGDSLTEHVAKFVAQRTIKTLLIVAINVVMVLSFRVVTPKGLIALMYGLIGGSRHDSTMLAESQLINTLQSLMPGDDGLPIYKLYSDPAYSILLYLWKAIPNPV
jgi:hypothetical protein